MSAKEIRRGGRENERGEGDRESNAVTGKGMRRWVGGEDGFKRAKKNRNQKHIKKHENQKKRGRVCNVRAKYNKKKKTKNV